VVKGKRWAGVISEIIINAGERKISQAERRMKSKSVSEKKESIKMK